jgi:endonuclease/exonuclease/phosphatase family metal-dependent hydrolase
VLLARATIAGSLLLAGCATARNYEDPQAPVYAGGAAVGRAASPELRVVTFNLQWGRHVDRAIELFSAPGPLQRPDLLVLQEMDHAGTKQLADALGYEYVYVPSAFHPRAGHDFGVALLSPWPLEEPRKLLLPHRSTFRKLRRSAAVATLRSPLGRVRVYGVHFEAPIASLDSVRRAQARAVAADLAGWPGPAVVAGDFNGRSGARELVKAGFEWPTEPVENTIGLLDADQIVARGLCARDEGSAGVGEDATDASDHDPVWAVLRSCALEPGSGLPPGARRAADQASADAAR